MELGARTKQQVGGGRLEGEDLWAPQEMGAGAGKAAMGVLLQHVMRVGDWVCRNRETGEVL